MKSKSRGIDESNYSLRSSTRKDNDCKSKDNENELNEINNKKQSTIVDDSIKLIVRRCSKQNKVVDNEAILKDNRNNTKLKLKYARNRTNVVEIEEKFETKEISIRKKLVDFTTIDDLLITLKKAKKVIVISGAGSQSLYYLLYINFSSLLYISDVLLSLLMYVAINVKTVVTAAK